jgi:hypothetical protein
MRTRTQWPTGNAYAAADRSRGLAAPAMRQGLARGIAGPGVVAPAVPAHRSRHAFWIILAAIVSQLTISSNLLQWVHIPYDSPGGLPLVKFHVGTYLAILAVAVQAREHRPVMPALVARITAAPAFPLAIVLFGLCAVYALLTTGMSGSAVYIESYAAAAFLGLALEQQSPQDLRRIAHVMVAIAAVNGLLCIGETALQRRLIPMFMTDPSGTVVAVPEFSGQFRGTALYEHPLAGASITMLAVFLCMAIPLKLWLKSATLAVLLISLIAFGGRAALVLTYSLSAAIGVIGFGRRLVQRRITAGIMAGVLGGLIAVPSLLAAIMFATPLGERITGKLYADDSAEVRVVQWHIFGNLNLHDWLFGMDSGRLNDVMLQIGLDPPLNDIENFWLLVFVTLGVVGFLLWISGLATIVARLWRAGGWYPRLILVAMLIVASTSNSLGRKSNVLFLCVAAVMSAAAFARPVEDDPAPPGASGRPTPPGASGGQTPSGASGRPTSRGRHVLPSIPAASMRRAAIEPSPPATHD